MIKKLIIVFSFIFIITHLGHTDLNDGLYAKIKTTKGEIMIKLTYEKTPMTVANFVGLAEGKLKNNFKNNKPYYNGLKFHRVIDNFMIQGGDPSGNGTGGPGYKFADEFHYDLMHDSPGVLSMANSGKNTNGSQFFITHVKTPWLDWKHSVFGNVISGQEVVNKIKQNDRIQSVEIIRIGQKAKNFIVDQKLFEKLQKENNRNQSKMFTEKKAKEIKIVEKRWPAAKKTRSGMYYIIQKTGKGKPPKNKQKVSVHYKGETLDGHQFDSSYARGKPLEFKIGDVIKGWNEALLTMKKGGKRILIIPPELGYGLGGAQDSRGTYIIHPNAFLVFTVELLDILKN